MSRLTPAKCAEYIAKATDAGAKSGRIALEDGTIIEFDNREPRLPIAGASPAAAYRPASKR